MIITQELDLYQKLEILSDDGEMMMGPGTSSGVGRKGSGRLAWEQPRGTGHLPYSFAADGQLYLPAERSCLRTSASMTVITVSTVGRNDTVP